KLARPRGLVLDSASALVVADTNGASSVFRVPLAGGIPKELAAVPLGTAALAADERSIFVVDDAVLRIPKSGGAPKKVAASPEAAQAIVLVRDDIVFLGSDPQAMTGSIWRIPKGGPPAAGAHTTMLYAGAARL